MAFWRAGGFSGSRSGGGGGGCAHFAYGAPSLGAAPFLPHRPRADIGGPAGGRGINIPPAVPTFTWFSRASRRSLAASPHTWSPVESWCCRDAEPPPSPRIPLTPKGKRRRPTTVSSGGAALARLRARAGAAPLRAFVGAKRRETTVKVLRHRRRRGESAAGSPYTPSGGVPRLT